MHKLTGLEPQDAHHVTAPCLVSCVALQLDLLVIAFIARTRARVSARVSARARARARACARACARSRVVGGAGELAR